MKKFIVLLIAAVLSIPAYAVTIGTWEHVADPCDKISGDGWIDWSWSSLPYNFVSIGPMPNSRYSSSTIGATDGSYSLKLTPPAGWGQYLSLYSFQCALPFPMSAFLNNTQLKVDITYDSASWLADTTYAAVYNLSMQTDSYGWHDVGGQASPTGANGVVFTDTLSPLYPGYLPIVDPGTTLRTWTGIYTWDYSAILPGGSYTGNHVSASDMWVLFVFAFNSDTAGAYYIDNVRLVPEPTTIAVLTIGLALLRKRPFKT